MNRITCYLFPNDIGQNFDTNSKNRLIGGSSRERESCQELFTPDSHSQNSVPLKGWLPKFLIYLQRLHSVRCVFPVPCIDNRVSKITYQSASSFQSYVNGRIFWVKRLRRKFDYSERIDRFRIQNYIYIILEFSEKELFSR